MTDFAEIVRPAVFAVAALMPIVNPLGTAPVFLSMSADLPTEGAPRPVAKGCLELVPAASAAMIVGSHVLRLFDISCRSFASAENC